MEAKSRGSVTVRPFDAEGVWESNHERHRAYAHELLIELEELARQVLAIWPEGAGRSIEDEQRHPEAWQLCKHRDRASDAVRIYAAMAVEGLINCYGVVTLGQAVFDQHFERFGLVPKLRLLLVTAANLDIPRNDPLVQLLVKVSENRNSLVHPKTIEVKDPYTHQRSAVKIPEVAQESVANMEAFFMQFMAAISGGTVD